MLVAPKMVTHFPLPMANFEYYGGNLAIFHDMIDKFNAVMHIVLQYCIDVTKIMTLCTQFSKLAGDVLLPSGLSKLLLTQEECWEFFAENMAPLLHRHLQL